MFNNLMRNVDTVCTSSPSKAAAFIRDGRLAAFPTETVYGLGADAFDTNAVQRIFEAKERPPDNPLITHVADIDQVHALARATPAAARTLMDRFFPGPLTLILPRHSEVPEVVSAGLDTIGVRMPDHDLCQQFLSACDTPVSAPSANRSGRPSPTTWEAVYDDLNGRIDCILQGGRTNRGLESTVVDCTTERPTVLRAGAITLEALRATLPETTVEAESEVQARSPGTRHRHYAPDAQVRLVDDPEDATPDEQHAYIGLEPPAEPDAFGHVHLCSDVEAYAHALFHFLRTSDASGCTAIYCQTVEPRGIGRALMDRMERAAGRR